jgi:uncharacterized protein YbaP (TraB family)
MWIVYGCWINRIDRMGWQATKITGWVALAWTLTSCAIDQPVERQNDFNTTSARPSPPARAVVCPPMAPELTPEITAKVRRNAKDVGPLWSIEKDGRVSWLYGTIHRGRLEWTYPGPAVMNALNAADMLGVETLQPEKIEAIGPGVPQGKVEPTHPMRMPNENLVYDLLETHFCVTPGGFKNARQVTDVAFGYGLATLAWRKDGSHPEFGLDVTLSKLAQQLNKPVVALENSADRAQYLKATGLLPAEVGAGQIAEGEKKVPLEPAAQQAQKIKKGIRDTTLAREGTVYWTWLGLKKSEETSMANIWLDQEELKKDVLADLERLDDVLLKIRSDNAALEQAWAHLNPDTCNYPGLCPASSPSRAETNLVRMNLPRETAMAKNITQLHESGQRLFVAVGAFHVRSQGLPALMRERGFKVEFVRQTN